MDGRWRTSQRLQRLAGFESAGGHGALTQLSLQLAQALKRRTRDCFWNCCYLVSRTTSMASHMPNVPGLLA